MATIDEVNSIVQKAYSDIRHDWYNGIPEVSVAKLILTVDVAGHSGYMRNEDAIYIRLGEGNLDDWDILETGKDKWPIWKINLVHEMMHEYQFKVLKEPTEEGVKLFQLFQTDEHTPKIFNKILGFEGPGHDSIFYTAVAKWSSYFGFTPEEIMKRGFI